MNNLYAALLKYNYSVRRLRLASDYWDWWFKDKHIKEIISKDTADQWRMWDYDVSGFYVRRDDA